MHPWLWLCRPSTTPRERAYSVTSRVALDQTRPDGFLLLVVGYPAAEHAHHGHAHRLRNIDPGPHILDLFPQLRSLHAEVVGYADVAHVQPAAEAGALQLFEVAGFGRFELAAVQVDPVEPQFNGAGNDAQQIGLARKGGVPVRKRLEAQFDHFENFDS